MKLFRIIKNGIRDAFKSVYRNFSLSFASISCVSITLIVVAIALTASFNVKNFSKEIKSEVTMSVYLNMGVSDEEVELFENTINNMDNVLPDWEVETPTQRKEHLIEEDDFWSSVGSLMENENEIFHRNYSIKVKDINKIKETADKIDSMDMVEFVNYGEGMVEQMINIFDLIEKVSFIIVIILIIVSIFLIINTIKLTIFSRKREISIMRVVGASNIMIKNPFVIEGFIIGLLGSIVPVFVVIYGYTKFYNSMNGYIFSPLIQLLEPTPFVYLISVVIAIIGVLVGMFGSARAVRKYLKV